MDNISGPGDEDDPSSSSPLTIEGRKANPVEGNTKPLDNDVLSSFREQWKRELGGSQSPEKVVPEKSSVKPSVETPAVDNNEVKAKQLFHRGIELERSGRLYEAVQHYKRAVQLLPDVERKLYAELKAEPYTDSKGDSEPELQHQSEDSCEIDGEDEQFDEDFLTRMQRLLDEQDRLCKPEIMPRGCHISYLPYELVLMMFRWVVSSELDARALERLSAVCRGFYIVAREKELWMRLCQRTWGLDCVRPDVHNFSSWREMYIHRQRVRLDGCYISKTIYARQGEKTPFKDEVNRPCFRITYYRYLRFFPEGLVLMWTTPEEPPQCVASLRRQFRKNSNILSGHYRLISDKVVIVVKKVQNEKSTTTRYRGRRKEPVYESPEQNFHMELELRNSKRRSNGLLVWCGYAVSSGDKLTRFDLPPDKFPPFQFTPVPSYTQTVYAPL